MFGNMETIRRTTPVPSENRQILLNQCNQSNKSQQI